MSWLLKTITANPAMSSNPMDYIKSNAQAYQAITEMGQPALAYMLAKLSYSHQSGLDEWIMAKACSDILGSADPVHTWASGLDWYEQYSNAVKVVSAKPPEPIPSPPFYIDPQIVGPGDDVEIHGGMDTGGEFSRGTVSPPILSSPRIRTTAISRKILRPWCRKY